MTDQQLRVLQDEFLQLLEDLGHFKRAGMTTPLFDNSSPTALQVQRDLWPAYTHQFKEFIRQWKKSDVIQSRPAYYKHHRACGSHEAGLAEPEAQPQPLRPVHEDDPGREAGEDVQGMPITARRLRKG